MITITAIGAKELAKEFADTRKRMDNLKDPLKESFDRYGEIESDIFRAEGAAWGGGAWKGLSEMQQAKREAAGISAEHPILDFYGDLSAAVWSGNSGGEGISVRTSLAKDSGEMVATGPKTFHHEGSTEGKYELPARPFWLWNKQIADSIREVWTKWMRNNVFAR